MEAPFGMSRALAWMALLTAPVLLVLAAWAAAYILSVLVAAEVKRQIDARVSEDPEAARRFGREVWMNGKIVEHADALRAEAEHNADTELFRYVQHTQSIHSGRRSKSPARMVPSGTGHALLG